MKNRTAKLLAWVFMFCCASLYIINIYAAFEQLISWERIVLTRGTSLIVFLIIMNFERKYRYLTFCFTPANKPQAKSKNFNAAITVALAMVADLLFNATFRVPYYTPWSVSMQIILPLMTGMLLTGFPLAFFSSSYIKPLALISVCLFALQYIFFAYFRLFTFESLPNLACVAPLVSGDSIISTLLAMTGVATVVTPYFRED